jgi:hypothetical protein
MKTADLARGMGYALKFNSGVGAPLTHERATDLCGEQVREWLLTSISR